MRIRSLAPLLLLAALACGEDGRGLYTGPKQSDAAKVPDAGALPDVDAGCGSVTTTGPFEVVCGCECNAIGSDFCSHTATGYCDCDPACAEFLDAGVDAGSPDSGS